jgi:hypothetical protein
VQKLRGEKLDALGIIMGDALMLLDVLHADVVPTPSAGAPTERNAQVATKRPTMRPFPRCGPTRYPDLEGWDPYKTGLRLRAAPEMRPQDVAVLRRVLDGGAVPGDWANGCPADVAELVNGTGAMPDDLLKLLPKPLKEATGCCSISTRGLLQSVRQQQQYRKKSSFQGAEGSPGQQEAHAGVCGGCLEETER